MEPGSGRVPGAVYSLILHLELGELIYIVAPHIGRRSELLIELRHKTPPRLRCPAAVCMRKRKEVSLHLKLMRQKE